MISNFAASKVGSKLKKVGDFMMIRCCSEGHHIKKENVQYFIDRANEYPKISDFIVDYLNSYLLGNDFISCQNSVEKLIHVFTKQ